VDESWTVKEAGPFQVLGRADLDKLMINIETVLIFWFCFQVELVIIWD